MAGEAIPVLEAGKDRGAARRALLASALGLLLGVQFWKLAEFGFAAAIPWFGVVWILCSQVLLGISTGLTSGCAWGWKRGFVLGLVFSIPSAAIAMGTNHTALCVAAIIEGLVAGPLIALVVDSLFVAELQPPEIRKVKRHVFSRTGERLESEKELLDALAAERAECRRPGFGISSEERIIWRELLDLELQDLDEQMSRLREEAARKARQNWKPESGERVG
uniref:Uncharacterized protein n=1 Tax=Solibacter usitatus (strain Ellin6076) TaxID=234267 RepID=Q01Y14_SOLUE